MPSPRRRPPTVVRVTNADESNSGGKSKARRPKRDRDSFFDKHSGKTPAVEPDDAPTDLPETDAGKDLPAPADTEAAPAAPELPDLPKIEVNANDDLPTARINPAGLPTAEINPAGADPVASTRRDVRATDEPVVTEPFSDVPGDSRDLNAPSGRRVAEHLTEDPLPYIEPQYTRPFETDEPASGAYTELAAPEHVDAPVVHAKRGTLDTGLLILRLMVGAIFVAHGLQKLFGWWDGPGIDGFATFLKSGSESDPSLGFSADWATPLAWVTGLTETIGGVLLIIGILTPVAGAGLLGVMIGAILYRSALTGGLSFFAASGGLELEYLLAAAAAALILTGPGLYAADRRWGWSRRPAWGSFVWLLIGIGSGIAVWFVFNGANPFPNI